MKGVALLFLLTMTVTAQSQVQKPGGQTVKPESSNAPASAPNTILTANGFREAKEIRFDESMGGTKPTPHIPKQWRIIGVSNGGSPNANNLWFQDSSGNIYLLQGFTSRDRDFVIDPTVQILRVQ